MVSNVVQSAEAVAVMTSPQKPAARAASPSASASAVLPKPEPSDPGVMLERTITLPPTKAAFSMAKWLEEQNRTRRVCACGCNTPTVVRRHHHTHGIPRYVQNHHPKDYLRAVTVEVQQIRSAGLLTLSDVAERLHIPRTTLRGFEGLLFEPAPRQGKRKIR